MPKSVNTKLSILFWLSLVIVYEVPNLVFFAYKIGFLHKMVEQHTRCDMSLNWRWYPSVPTVTDHLFGPEENVKVTFVQADILRPWNHTNYILFDRFIANTPGLESKLELNRKEAGSLPWGKVYFLPTRENQKIVNVYAPDYFLSITVPEMSLLLEIKNIKLLKNTTN